jgi:hypothetical protein
LLRVIARRFSLWQKAVALAPLLLLAACLPGEIMVRCHVDGLVRPAPCCEHEQEPPDEGPAFEDRDCCDRELTARDRPVLEAARVIDGAPVSPAAVTAAASRAVAFPPEDRGARARQRYGPAREGPSIVLAKQAFLI